MSEDDRLIASFEEITAFVENTGHEPKPSKQIKERRLYSRLKGIRGNLKNAGVLIESGYDKFNLLEEQAKELQSVKDIMEDDDLGILDDPTGIFSIKQEALIRHRKSAEFVAQRKACKDFDEFEPLFLQCHQDLKNGRRQLERNFRSDQKIQQGRFCLINGMLLYLAKVVRDRKDVKGTQDGRLRVIFENGTESNMLLRSLSRRIRAENGKMITDPNGDLETELSRKAGLITDKDQQAGYIYVLKSLSQNEQIASLKDLYKIGFTTGSVESRISNAEKKPTYLMAPVAIVATFKCFNFNPQNLEQKLHAFFGKSCLNIDVFDKNGKRHSPREWFVAPYEIIKQVISLVVENKINDFRFNKKLNLIERLVLD